jgi:hypothetical protein
MCQFAFYLHPNLIAVADETVDADDMRQFFIDQLDEVLNELKQL